MVAKYQGAEFDEKQFFSWYDVHGRSTEKGPGGSIDLREFVSGLRFKPAPDLRLGRGLTPRLLTRGHTGALPCRGGPGLLRRDDGDGGGGRRARRRGGGSGGATPDPLPPATLPAFDLCFSAPAPPTIPPSHRCFADILVRSQGMGLIIQQLTRHAEGGSAP